MATIIVDKFINEIGFRFTKESRTALEGVERGIKSLRRFALVSGVALAGLGIALDKVAGSIDKQAKFARGIDVTFERMQQLEFAAKKAGVPVEELDSFMEMLAKTSASTIPGQYNAALLQLGISAKDVNNQLKTPLGLLLEIGDKLKNLPKLRQAEFGGARLGASVRLTQFLAQGSGEIVKNMKEAQDIGAIIPERVTKQVAEFFDDALLKVKSTLKALTDTVLVSFLPALSKMLLEYDKWIVANEKIVSSNIGDFIKGVSQGFANFGKISAVALSSFSNLVQSVSGSAKTLSMLKIISFSVTGALVALSAAFIVARAPMILVGITVAKLISMLPDLENLLSKIAQLFNAVFPSAANSASQAFNSVIQSVDNMIEALNRLIPFRDTIKGFKEDFDDLFGSISNFASIKGVSNIADKALGQIGLGAKGQNVIQSLVQQTEAGKSVSLSPQGLASSQNSTNNVIINVNGAGDPKSVAREVKNQMELSTATQTANPGFNRPRVS
jgi:hypothetical protein